MILDAFAGPGGWDEGARPLGLRPIGIEWDMPACRTAKAAGHERIRADVARFPLDHLAGKVTGLIMSPPCQDFSLAGKQAGIEGDKGQLIREVLRWTDTLRPRWVACEQVPPCLDLWREYAATMRGWGYRTWVGVLNAADYGVPQTRKRAILMASLDRQPERPWPTHARGGDVDLFAERQPWITMAEALGWGMTDRPFFTIPTAGDKRGGADEQVGGSGARRSLYRELEEGRWAWERPATTVVGSFAPDIIAAPGYRTEVSRQNAAGSIRVSLADVATLQSFPPDYPWQGSKTKQFQQVGNAVPPRLATHVLSALTGIPLPHTMEVAA